MPNYIVCEGCWCRKLAEPITFILRLAPVESSLKVISLSFHRLQGFRHWLNPKLSKIVDPVFPNPIDTFSSFVSKIAAIEVAAKEQIETDGTSVITAQLCHLNRFLLATF